MVSRAPRARVVVIGSGAFARAVCYSIATELSEPADVFIVARNDRKAAEVAFVARARAVVSGVPAEFHGRGVDLDKLDEMLVEAAPDLLIQCASHQSPWERTTAPSAWTELVAAAGFGITLPLQLALVGDVAAAVQRVVPDCLLINACFPDAVNPALHALGLPVFCGIGNISTIAAAAQSAMRRTDHSDVRLLAHHVHLHAPENGADEARIWCDGVERDDATALLSGMRAAARAELNQIGGHAAARLLAALLDGTELDTHVPGPLGLPGGYPVRIRDRRIELRLPDGIDTEAAVAWNQRAALLDGVQVADGRVRFPPDATEQLRPHLPDLAAGFPVSRVGSAGVALLDLRERLRGRPS